MAPHSRRRFLSICAAAALLPGHAHAAAPIARWRGVALGAEASLTFAGLGPDAATPLIDRVTAEIERLEEIFSLYRVGSAVSRFNARGRLSAPPPELLELLTLCGGLHRRTGGAFDPTVQPLWALHAQAAARATSPTAEEIEAVRAQTGWDGLRFDSGALAATRPGVALTLNGIAQGYIADRITGLLRGAGLTGVLVDMGEIYALGTRADGRPWRVGIAQPAGDGIAGRIGLSDRALATSAPQGTVLDQAGRVGHIIDPRTGRPGGKWRQVSVSAPRAALADGLSTAFCLMDRAAIESALSKLPGTRLEAAI